MCHFQVTLIEIDIVMTDWELEWRNDVAVKDIVECEDEDEETLVDKKDNEDEEVEPNDDNAEEEVLGKEDVEPIVKKTSTRQSKKDTSKKKKPTQMETDSDALDQETINVLSKRKLPLADLGSTPKKARGSPAQFPQTKE